MQKSTVSRAIASLEKTINRQLLYRTTRQIEPTPQGKELFAKCHQGLSSLLTGVAQGLEHSKPMQGKVRIAAVQDIGIVLLSPILTEFAQLHSGLQIEMLFEDKVVDLVSQSIDISVRAGQVKQQSYRGRKVGTVKFILVASPKYLERIGKEITLENLKEFDFLSYQPMLQKGYFLFEKSNNRIKFTPTSRFLTGSTLTLYQMACSGAGIAALPDFLCEEALKKDALVRVLNGWSTPTTPISVVTPARKNPSSTVSVFSEFLCRKLSERL